MFSASAGERQKAKSSREKAGEQTSGISALPGKTIRRRMRCLGIHCGLP